MSAGLSKILSDSHVIAASSTTYSNPIDLQAFAEELILVSTVSSRTDGTYTVTLQESPDNVNWYDVDSCAAQNANGQVIKKIAVSTFHFLRAKMVAAAVTTGATLKVQLYYSKKW